MPSWGAARPAPRARAARHVRARPAAVRADDPQPAPDEARDLDRRPLADRRDADGDHPAAVPQHLDRLQERLRAAQDLEGDVHAAVRDGEDARDGILDRCVDHVRGAERRGRPQLLLADVDGDDLRGALARANWTTSDPTPPVPTTATRSPRRSSAPCRTAPYAVSDAHPRIAASSSGRRRAARRPRWRAAPRTPRGRPSSTSPAGCRRRGRGGSRRRRAHPQRLNVKNGSQMSSRPRMQAGQLPHGMMNVPTTRVPSASASNARRRPRRRFPRSRGRARQASGRPPRP